MSESRTPRAIDEEKALRSVVEGTASETGEAFCRALVQNMARALDTHGAWMTEYFPEREHMRGLAFWFGGRWIDGFEYELAGTPCETAVRETRIVHIPDRIIDLYPGQPKAFADAGVVSYLGYPLLDSGGRVLGHVAVIDNRPMPEEKRLLALFQIFANRAAAELQRMRLDAELHERQEKLRRLVDSAMDAIIEVDGDLRVTMLNLAAEKIFTGGDRACGHDVADLLGADAAGRVRACTEDLKRLDGDQKYLWIPDGLTIEPGDGRAFHALATLSHYEVGRRPYFTLILRDVEEWLEATRRIESLDAQAQYLRGEIDEDHGFGAIVGRSPALRQALQSVAQVAVTDATVLLIGETGTGKELFARAIHDRSPRSGRPLIKVNCAAIPASLMESEFFGHERGAFTGATQRREGRFALADGGTIFLDEIGELPLELQGKLLRVLQEGEFEAVGGSRTHKVDVRVLAASNRDLEHEVRNGAFREDLYYRLSVFPLRLPPLRERDDDVVLIATNLVESLSRRMRRKVAPLSDADAAALKAYPWPGNVRELRNVVERTLITSTDGRLHLERELPDAPTPAPAVMTSAGSPHEVLSVKRLRQLERDNMIAALERADWRVGGAGGASDLLGVSASTFKSRMKALGIERPRAR